MTSHVTCLYNEPLIFICYATDICEIIIIYKARLNDFLKEREKIESINMSNKSKTTIEIHMKQFGFKS